MCQGARIWNFEKILRRSNSTSLVAKFTRRRFCEIQRFSNPSSGLIFLYRFLYRKNRSKRAFTSAFKGRVCNLIEWMKRNFYFCTKFVPKIANSSKAETNRYLNKFHEERRQRLTLLLDSEEWRAAEVPRELQEAVDAVLAQGQGHTDQRTDKPKRPGKNNNSKALNNDFSKLKNFLVLAMAVDVSGEKFAVIGCSLLLIRMIQEYLGCLSKLPEPSLLHKLADLLSLFNSRCCQL